MLRRASLLPHTLAGMLASLPMLAGAQTVEVIEVTAQRRPEPVQQVPMSITALSGRELERSGVLSSYELDQQVSGLQASTSNGVQMVFSLRGVSMSDFNSTEASPIGVYLDEAYLGAITTHGMAFFDLDRIEVLKGPQGTLYGKNTTGGAINLITRSPALDAAASGEIRAGIGDYGARRLFAAGETALSPGVLAIRAAFDADHDHGYIKNRLGPAMAQTDRYAARVTINGLLAPATDVLVKLTHSHSSPRTNPPRMEGIFNVPGLGMVNLAGYTRPADMDYLETAINKAGRALVELDLASARLRHQGGLYNVTAVTSWYRTRYRLEADGDGSPQALIEPDWRFNGHALSQDVRIASNWNSPFSIIAGVYWNREQRAMFNTYRFFDTPLPLVQLQDPALAAMLNAYGLADHSMTTETSSAAAYAQGRWQASEQLGFDAGVRFTSDRSRLDYINISQRNTAGVPAGSWVPGNTSGIDAAFLPPGLGGRYLTGPYTTASGPLRTEREHNWSGKLGADYRMAPHAMAYASVSNGFRSGAFNPGLVYSPDTVIRQGYTRPETITALEAGIKQEWPQNRLRLNVAGYDYRYRNQQFINVVGASTMLLNAGEAHIRGMEAEVQWRPTDAWKTTAGINLMHTKYTELVLGADRLDGNALISAPRARINAAVDYRTRLAYSGTLELGLAGSAQGRQWYSAYNGRPGYQRIGQSGYGLLNARAALSDSSSRYTLIAQASNVLDRRYDSYAISLAGFGFDYFIQGAPRRLSLTLQALY
ncbi:TonB-dependent receptor [Pseudoduganella ginsengisoli]|uniref:TonB-dependent receptor n=1 Tax=Pseudoduganella ginsengisoli TaxID=1462440 RepID=A0A6L6Q4Q8_9BURK|nr:TonB-dependent receptor [Pseudoduganella ginsengisoli]MTW04843.1 TonB-dependent receptor [Pseudoduganella ginsengisoli]